MPNMSYCRFQNTLKDLVDCEEHLGDDESEMSYQEKVARARLVKLCKRIAADWEE